MEDKLKTMKEEYQKIEIPKELDEVVERVLSKGRKKKYYGSWLIGAAAAVALFTGGVNASPAMANALLEIPVIGNVVKVLTFTEYRVEDKEQYHANIKVPEVTGLENEELAGALNEKYIQDGHALYEQFMTDMEMLEANGGGHYGVDSGYKIKTDTDRILSIGRYVTWTVGSSSTVMKYDTIDKQNEILLSLPMLFKDDRYVKVISENIKEQMIAKAQEDPNNIYWAKGAGLDEEVMSEGFETIQTDQNFYITNSGKLVISFDKYEVAPGYMGIVEFEIPTEALSDVLVSDEYIH